MAELWFIRHFRTPWNLERRLQGRRDIAIDDPLGAADLAALERNRATLADVRFARVLCSPLLRARATAALHGFPDAVPRDELAELDFGPWEGRLWSELDAEHPDVWHSAPERLPLGETIDAFAARVRAIHDEIRSAPGDRVLLFGHGAWHGCLHCIVAGRPVTEFSRYHGIANGGLVRIGAAGPAAGSGGVELSSTR